MISKFLRRSDPTLTSSEPEEMPTLGVGGRPGAGAGEGERRGRQGALRVTPDPSPAGGQRLSSDPGNAPRAGLGRCRTSPGRGAGPGGA